MTIPAELVKRWRGQIETPYTELTEAERKSDSKEAGKFMKLFNKHSTEENVMESTSGEAKPIEALPFYRSKRSSRVVQAG